MDTLYNWIHLATRWFHVVAGVLWIGQTAFFAWLDTRMRIEQDDQGIERVWMVHSGGFYRVEKLGVPDPLPRVLHWFKWEAAASWLSGILMLALVYYYGGALLDFSSEASLGVAIMISLAVLAFSWLVYDFLWNTVFVEREALGSVVSTLALFALGYAMSRVFSGRAAYIHVGAVMGTIMTANVWMRILPGQRAMVESLKAGEEPDLSLGLRAKERSTHNTFMALPLIFIMVSNHFPIISYGHNWNWLMLAGFITAGFVARAGMNRWNRRS